MGLRSDTHRCRALVYGVERSSYQSNVAPKGIPHLHFRSTSRSRRPPTCLVMLKKKQFSIRMFVVMQVFFAVCESQRERTPHSRSATHQNARHARDATNGLGARRAPSKAESRIQAAVAPARDGSGTEACILTECRPKHLGNIVDSQASGSSGSWHSASCASDLP